MTEAIAALRAWMTEKSKRKHTKGRLVDPVKGFNEILYPEFKRLVANGAEPEQLDMIILQLRNAGYITKVEGIIIHLSIDKFLKKGRFD